MTQEERYQNEQAQKKEVLRCCGEHLGHIRAALDYVEKGSHSDEFKNADEAFESMFADVKAVSDLVAEANRAENGMIGNHSISCPTPNVNYHIPLKEAIRHARDIATDTHNHDADTRAEHQRLYNWLTDVDFRQNGNGIFVRFIKPDMEQYHALVSAIDLLKASLDDPNHEWPCFKCKREHEDIYGWLTWLRKEWKHELGLVKDEDESTIKEE